MQVEKRYNEEGLEIVECPKCHNDILLCKAGKIGNANYCNGCYKMAEQERIKDWKIDFKRSYNNGNELPKLSSYIN